MLILTRRCAESLIIGDGVFTALIKSLHSFNREWAPLCV